MSEIKKLTITGILMALSVVLSYVIHSIGGMALGTMLLPLHFMILLIGLLCGLKYGIIAGILLPFINFMLTGRPPFPTNLLMAIELATYGGIIALCKKKIPVIISLPIAMIAGRVINLFSTLILYQLQDNDFALKAFLTKNVIDGLLGIVLQLIFIPAIIYALKQAKLILDEDVKW